MPKDTFFNLPEEKRSLICDVAFDEFAEYSFDQASINRIVANAGIAKGSFYQYFEDKQDLYLYLMELISAEKISYLTPILSSTGDLDIFTLVRKLFLSGIQFALEHPRYAAIGDKLLVDKQAPMYKKLKEDSRPTSFAFYGPLLERARARGEIRDDLDIEMVNYFISSLNMAVVEYCSEKHPDNLYEEIAESIDRYLDLLKNGIGVKIPVESLNAL